MTDYHDDGVQAGHMTDYYDNTSQATLLSSWWIRGETSRETNIPLKGADGRMSLCGPPYITEVDGTQSGGLSRDLTNISDSPPSQKQHTWSQQDFFSVLM